MTLLARPTTSCFFLLLYIGLPRSYSACPSGGCSRGSPWQQAGRQAAIDSACIWKWCFLVETEAIGFSNDGGGCEERHSICLRPTGFQRKLNKHIGQCPTVCLRFFCSRKQGRHDVRNFGAFHIVQRCLQIGDAEGNKVGGSAATPVVTIVRRRFLGRPSFPCWLWVRTMK
jgi:hypothetical protein